MKRRRKNSKQTDIFITAFKKSNREIQFLRYGGGQFVSTHKIHQNKKKYDRKRDRKNFDSDGLFLCVSFARLTIINLRILCASE